LWQKFIPCGEHLPSETATQIFNWTGSQNQQSGCKHPVEEIPEENISLSRLFNDRLLVLSSEYALF
jgi:hypothetical protein